MDGLQQIVGLGQLTAAGVLLIAVLLIFLGRLIPRSTVTTLLAAKDSEIARAIERGDQWHIAYEARSHESDLKTEQIRELIEVARATEHLLEAWNAVARGPGAAP